MIKENGYW